MYTLQTRFQIQIISVVTRDIQFYTVVRIIYRIYERDMLIYPHRLPRNPICIDNDQERLQQQQKQKQHEVSAGLLAACMGEIRSCISAVARLVSLSRLLYRVSASVMALSF